jgi:hypothetical protein
LTTFKGAINNRARGIYYIYSMGGPLKGQEYSYTPDIEAL